LRKSSENTLSSLRSRWVWNPAKSSAPASRLMAAPITRRSLGASDTPPQPVALEMGLESGEIVGACESAYGCAYYDTISWRNETTPLPMENRPRAIFERMFGDAGTDPKVRLAFRQEDRSILDAVNSDIKRMRGKVGGTDRAKVDQYLEAIRDVERRMQLAEEQDVQAPPMGSPV